MGLFCKAENIYQKVTGWNLICVGRKDMRNSGIVSMFKKFYLVYEKNSKGRNSECASVQLVNAIKEK